MAPQFSLGDAVLNIVGDLKGLNKSLEDAKRYTKKHFGAILETVKGLSEGFAIAGAAITVTLTEIISKTTEAGEQIDVLRRRTGATSEFLAGLKVAADRSGTSIEGIAKAFKGMEKSILSGGAADEKADENSLKRKNELTEKISDLGEQIKRANRDYGDMLDSKNQAQFFETHETRKWREGIDDKRTEISKFQRELVDAQKEMDDLATSGKNPYAQLGIDLAALKKEKPDKQFRDIMVALFGVKDETERAGLAMKVFSKTGVDVLPMIADGVDELDKNLEKANRFGITPFAREWGELSEAFVTSGKDIDSSFFGLFKNALMPLLPQLTAFKQKIVDIIVGVKDWVVAHQDLTAKIIKWTGIVGVVMGALGSLGFAVAFIVPWLATMAAALSGLLVPFALLTVAVDAAVYAWESNLGGFKDWILEFLADLELTFRGGWKGFWDSLLIDLKIDLNLMKKALLDFRNWDKEGLKQLIKDQEAALAKAKADPFSKTWIGKQRIAYGEATLANNKEELAKREEQTSGSAVSALTDEYNSLMGEKNRIDADKLKAIGGKTFVQSAAEGITGFLNSIKNALNGPGAQKLFRAIPVIHGVPEWLAVDENGISLHPGMSNPMLGDPNSRGTFSLHHDSALTRRWAEIADRNFGPNRRAGHAAFINRMESARDAGRSTESIVKEIQNEQLGKAIARELVKIVKPVSGLFVINKAAQEYENANGAVS